MKLKKRYIVYFMLLLAFGALVSYRIVKQKKAAPGGQALRTIAPLRVDGMVLTPQLFVDSLSVKGTLEANEQVQIRSQVSGVVTGIYFREGARVQKGQVLLQIDRSELNAQLSQARTREQLALENARRAKLLLEKEAISQEEFQTAEAELKSLQAQTRLIEAQSLKTTIRAPFPGTIGLRSVSVGAYLNPETIVANLVNTDPLKLTFSVSEQYANSIKTNTMLQFNVAGDEHNYLAKVYAMEPALDTDTRTLQMRASVENRKGLLKPGAFANIRLPLQRIDHAILAPTQAIVPVQNGKKVFIVKDGKARETMVETSSRTDVSVVITSGLQSGDTLLTTGMLTLKNGTPVTVEINQTVQQ